MAKKLKKYQSNKNTGEVKMSPFMQKLTTEEVDSLKKRIKFRNSLISPAKQDSLMKSLTKQNKKD
jgi:hypothetical protein